nr:zinc finger, CCHC-type [Tanacetum cinerariifolium]
MCILKCFEEVFGLRVNYNKSRLYGVGVSDSNLDDMARWMKCGIGDFPFMYLGLPIGENMNRENSGGDSRERVELSGLGSFKVFMVIMRLYHLDMTKEGRVTDKGKWENNVWRWEWDWGLLALEALRWPDFKVKEASKMAEEKILRGRLLVREELDKRGIDLDSPLCPSCDSVAESCSHCLVTCDLAMNVWNKIFRWWKVGYVNAFSIDMFKRHDFRRWQKKMHFLLTTLKLVYVLTTPMLELLEDATIEAIRIRAKWENDDYICRGHILNGMSDSLFDVYTNVESAKELWDSIESKYMAEDSLSKKLLDFKHTLKHGKDDLSLVQLGCHLHIEESLRAQDSDKGKGKKRSNENNSGSGSNKKPKLECWKYGKTGHFKRDYRSGKKNNANVGGSGKGSKDQSQDQGQNLVPVWNRFMKFSVSLIFEAFYVQVDAIAWWIDSGATTHFCKDHCWFKTFEPVEDGSVHYMGDENFAPIHGKGCVALEFSSGKTVTLFLYVPKLRKNLVSGPVLNKCGYKQVYESDKYILSKCGVFVRFGYYNNGMFMLNLNKVPDDSYSVYMSSSSTVVNTSLWHARLGH